MESDLKQALARYLLALGDDELILGHRNSEWCGHAPILEEDIALANLALDELGHAAQWYGLLAELEDKEAASYADQLAFFRGPTDFRNIQLVELPNGDWAFSLLRQYLFDAAESLRLERLAQSAYPPLAAAARRIRKEEIYHLRHSQAWMQRLGLGTEESNRRLQKALEMLWPLAGQIFSPLPQEERLVQAGFTSPSDTLLAAWEAQVRAFLRDCGLSFPKAAEPASEGQQGASPPQSRSEHTQHLKILLAEMQSVARLNQQAGW